MRLDIKLGERRRCGDGWTRRDRVTVNGKPLRGFIETKGRRKRPEVIITSFGSAQRPGSDPYWLAARNGIKHTDVIEDH